LKWAYRGIGELAVAVGFGPLLVLGSYFVQTQRFSLEAFFASLVPGLLIMLILYVNEIPDRTWDDEAGKKTLVARMKEESVTNGYIGSLAVAYAVICLSVVGGLFPPTALLALLTVPVAFKVTTLIKGNLGNPYGLMPTMSKNIRLYAYTTLLLLAGYLISFVI
jgi:1,4-dihydroxy-2-naphthoate octaprenyltransferase